MFNHDQKVQRQCAASNLIKKLTISCLIPVLIMAFVWTSGLAQSVTNPDGNPSTREWLEFKQARYNGRSILVHLRTGFERAVIMPEPIRLSDPSSVLPGCAVAIDTDVVGFFPTRTFARKPLRLTGLITGTVYELRVRASPQGIQQVLQILR